MISQIIAFIPLSMAVLFGGSSHALKTHILSEHTISLDKRYGNQFVNDVFKDNILLNLKYMEGKIQRGNGVNWSEITKPFNFEFKLKPEETFSFHDDVLPSYRGKVTKTTNAHFNSDEGFKSDGYLVGDGVCHLASIIYWVAKDAGLDSLAPTNHDFANIPEVPREYGVAIYYYPNQSGENEQQNLYIKNNRKKDVDFAFHYDGRSLTVSVTEAT